MVKWKKQKPAAKKVNARKERIKSSNKALEELVKQVQEYDPNLIDECTKFSDLPISEESKKGLKAAHYMELTDIQKKAIIPALQGNDILGAARTGSGKTLAFLIPALEALFRLKWTTQDGMGVLIITPTRELALQIFDVLMKIGGQHSLSAGLVIGGKDLQQESERIQKINILIGTPGRVLQHMDQTAGFDTTNLQMLILDEADRCLDMGFKSTLDAIVENLPEERQTLLFSATQTKVVSDLARLSLDSPMYISAHELLTPKSLDQYYVEVPLPEKLDTLWSFLRTHLKAKILVFMASTKQVRFVYETFRQMQPGIPLLHLHGKQKQMSRIDTVHKFSSSQNSCLFATDVVARGIDFPSVDWVVQLDCPDDSATYIHRVGRSARFNKEGKALLMLTPSEEEGMIAHLESKNIPIVKINIRDGKKKSIQPDLQKACFKDPQIKYLGQKAFSSYVRSIYLQKDKQVFKFKDIPMEEFATSLGLPGAPNVKIKGTGKSAKELKNMSYQLQEMAAAGDSDEEEGEKKPKKAVRTKYDRMFERQNQDVLSEHYQKMTNERTRFGGKEASNDEDDDEDGELMTVKRTDHSLESDVPNLLNTAESKRAAKRALSKKQTAIHSAKSSTKLKFDDEGNPHAIYEFQDYEDFEKDGDAETQKLQFIDREAGEMESRDIEDKETARLKRQEKKRKRQEAERLVLQQEQGYSDSELQAHLDEAAEGSDREEPAAKRWFQRDEDEDEEAGKDVVYVEEVPESLEDLEALSASLLKRR